MADARIITAFGRKLTVRYKGESDEAQNLRDPVSEVYQDVEALI